MKVFNSHRFLPLSVVLVRCRRLQDLRVICPCVNTTVLEIQDKKICICIWRLSKTCTCLRACNQLGCSQGTLGRSCDYFILCVWILTGSCNVFRLDDKSRCCVRNSFCQPYNKIPIKTLVLCINLKLIAKWACFFEGSKQGRVKSLRNFLLEANKIPLGSIEKTGLVWLQNWSLNPLQ